MTDHRKRGAVVMLFLLTAFLLFPETPVGTITKTEGAVTVDAFGTGDFIAAIRFEVLYAVSVVRTGEDGQAVIEIGEELTYLEPNTEQKIGDLLGSAPKAKRFRWVRALTGAVKSVYSAIVGTKDEERLGGRAGVAEAPKVGWVTEDENKDAFDAALELIKQGSYEEAVAELSTIFDPLPRTFLPAEVEFWLGHCYYQLELFYEAKAAHILGIESLDNMLQDPWVLPHYEQMVFQAGTSSYFTGDYQGSADYLNFIIDKISDEYAPFAYLVLVDSLIETGRFDEAGKYLNIAQSKFAGTVFAADFEQLAEEL